MILDGTMETTYRRDAINAAKDLGYDKTVIARIREAETEIEITKILAEARRSGVQNTNNDYDDIPEEPKKVKKKKKLPAFRLEQGKRRRNFNDRFQRWCNSNGKCGKGSVCTYCDDKTKCQPCVSALNRLCKENHISLDYSRRDFAEVWGGTF